MQDYRDSHNRTSRHRVLHHRMNLFPAFALESPGRKKSKKNGASRWYTLAHAVKRAFRIRTEHRLAFGSAAGHSSRPTTAYTQHLDLDRVPLHFQPLPVASNNRHQQIDPFSPLVKPTPPRVVGFCCGAQGILRFYVVRSTTVCLSLIPSEKAILRDTASLRAYTGNQAPP